MPVSVRPCALTAAAKASSLGAVFPVAFALPGQEIGEGKFRVSIGRPIGPGNCTTVAGVLADARAGGGTCYYNVTPSVWGLVEVRMSGAEMPEVAQIKAGNLTSAAPAEASPTATPSSGAAARGVSAAMVLAGLVATVL